MENECCCQQNSNSGFIFGLICGAVIGAIIAIVIYKNNKTEVFENLQTKIKQFFQNLVGEEEKIKTSTKVTSRIIASKSESTPIITKPKKPTPKMFVKPKK